MSWRAPESTTASVRYLRDLAGPNMSRHRNYLFLCCTEHTYDDDFHMALFTKLTSRTLLDLGKVCLFR